MTAVENAAVSQEELDAKAWAGFTEGNWQKDIDVRDFIQKNYTPYDGNDQFLEGPTQSTTELWDQVMELSKKELEAGGVLDMDTKVISTITSHGPGYLNKDKETIVGFQTDKPFKRSLQPYGGIRMAMNKGGKVYVRAGAGIVRDSVPASEYNETLIKGQSMISAITDAQEVE